MTPQAMEAHAEWRRADVSNQDDWTLNLSEDDKRGLDAALRHALAVSSDMLDITRDDFPLPSFGKKLDAFNDMLINGRGFGLIRGLDRSRYSNDEMCMLYW